MEKILTSVNLECAKSIFRDSKFSKNIKLQKLKKYIQIGSSTSRKSNDIKLKICYNPKTPYE